MNLNGENDTNTFILGINYGKIIKYDLSITVYFTILANGIFGQYVYGYLQYPINIIIIRLTHMNLCHINQYSLVQYSINIAQRYYHEL